MLYENGKQINKKEVSGQTDLSKVKEIVEQANEALLSQILKRLNFVELSKSDEDDSSGETLSKLAKMFGEGRDLDVSKEIGEKKEIKGDLEKDKDTIDFLKTLD